ncbi:putative drug antiporter protein precursor [Wenxinia marina]|nr:putative drug antiporter protein precursor [Wenxinia marina]
MIAVPWLVLTELGDPIWAGVVAFAEIAPYVVAKAAGGPLIDRLSARRVSVWTDLASVAALAAVPLLYGLGVLTPLLLVPLMALVGTLRGPADAAKYAMVPSVAEAADVPLTRVTGLISGIERLSGLVGAGLAAGLVALIGPANALAVNAGLVGLAALVVAVGLPGLGRPEPDDSGEGYLAQLRGGWRFLRADGTLLAITMMVAVTNLLDQGMAVVLQPLWAQGAGGVAYLGASQVCFGVGALCGSLVAAGWAERVPRLRTYAIGFFLIGLPRFALFVVPLPIWTLFVGLAIGGFAAGFINPIVSAIIFERVPRRLVGRVSSLFTAIAWSLMPLGGLAAGALVQGAGLTAAFLALGAAYFAATMVPFLVPGFRRMDARAAEAEVEKLERAA